MSAVEFLVSVCTEILISILARLLKGCEVAEYQEIAVAEGISAESVVSTDFQECGRSWSMARGEEGLECPSAQLSA